MLFFNSLHFLRAIRFGFIVISLICSIFVQKSFAGEPAYKGELIDWLIKERIINESQRDNASVALSMKATSPFDELDTEWHAILYLTYKTPDWYKLIEANEVKNVFEEIAKSKIDDYIIKKNI